MRCAPFATHVVLGLLLGCMAPVTHAAGNPRPITAQDLWAVKRLGPPALSPDGKRAVYSVQEWSIEKNKPSSSLWITEVKTGATRRLTFQTGNDSAPDWSHDGTRIAFVSKRGEDEAASLYVIDVAGGEAEKVLDLPYGIRAPRWLPNGQSNVFATQVIPSLTGKLQKNDWAAMKK